MVRRTRKDFLTARRHGYSSFSATPLQDVYIEAAGISPCHRLDEVQSLSLQESGRVVSAWGLANQELRTRSNHVSTSACRVTTPLPRLNQCAMSTMITPQILLLGNISSSSRDFGLCDLIHVQQLVRMIFLHRRKIFTPLK